MERRFRIDLYVVDGWIVRLWAQVLPKIVVSDDLVLRDGDYTGWAFRKGSPQLQAAIEAFYVDEVKKQGGLDARLRRRARAARAADDRAQRYAA